MYQVRAYEIIDKIENMFYTSSSLRFKVRGYQIYTFLQYQGVKAMAITASPFEIYAGVVVLAIALLIYFGKPFVKNAAAMTGMVHYCYVFIYKTAIMRELWTCTFWNIVIPLGISSVIIVVAWIYPPWRKSWMKKPQED
ncbi:MAG TPA: hypothetical protein VLK22_01325 [Candidatus Udaeobacter sp.]|nr:hypothetical protein [Candidatus Udaeobacter sp.]